MNRVSSGLILCGVLLSLASCSHDEGFNTGGPQGKITLDVTTDAAVLMNTRADDTKVSVIPQPSQFAISFEKQDGSFSQTWASLNLFNKESSFPIGTYTLSASYGNPEKEGFELPYFLASTDVTVESGIESHVALTATLANSMVSIRYTDEFKSNFSAYSAALKAASSSDYVVFTQEEDRPAYMKAERISVQLTLTNNQGNQVKVSPYSFTAEGRHHYIVTMGVKDSQGSDDVRLDVQITEEVESEFVEIPLGDELFTAPKPILKAVDFPSTMKYEDFNGFEPEGDPRIDVIAYGGLRAVNLNVSSNNTLIFGNSVQLVNADALTQQNIASTGLVTEGFYRNPDKAGVIKFKEFLSNLPVGTYKFSVEVEDSRTIMCDTPVEFEVTVKPVEVKLAVAKHPEYMGEEMSVVVTSNKPDVKNKIRFEVTDANEQWTVAKVLADPQAVKGTRADQQYSFTYRLGIPQVEHYDVKVRAFYSSETEPKDEITDDGVIFPEYKVEADPYSYKALLRITPKDASKLGIIRNNIKLLIDGNERPLVYNEKSGLFEVGGLYPSTTYSKIQACLSYVDNPMTDVTSFTTESATELPNPGFNDISQTIYIPSIQVGGQYRNWSTNYTIKSSIERYVPDGWATVNEKTCWKDAKNLNSWFVVPSTYYDNGSVILQTVGYSHDGKTPARSGSQAGTNNPHYCTNTPTDAELEKASGEFFLGQYSFDGQEHRTDGLEWKARPETVYFSYSYEAYNNEKGEFYLRLLDSAGNELNTVKYELTDGAEKDIEIDLPDYLFGRKAAKLEFGFRSTKAGIQPSVKIPSGSELEEGAGNPITPYITTKGPNDYHTFAYGSKLTIKNVRLGYGAAETQNLSKRRQNVEKRSKSLRK